MIGERVFREARIVLLGITFMLAGCGANVVLDKTYPKPLVQTIPLSIGVYYSEEFKAFSKQEKDKDRGKFVINIGASQVSLFDTLLAGSFTNVKNISSFPIKEKEKEKESNLNAVLVPEVTNLQFSIPKHTQAKIFEVWISYNMRLLTPSGAVIMEWPLSAYGKTPLKYLKTTHTSLTQATHAALRDAGAQFILSLEQSRIQKWLNTQLAVVSYSPHVKEKE